ncbi:hypothetical protein ASE85_18710 [Sphingobium sp. Leaf26]|nr:hypothetical protein ASE85_18710 [Sphingobium sp. Leaf26]
MIDAVPGQGRQVVTASIGAPAADNPTSAIINRRVIERLMAFVPITAPIISLILKVAVAMPAVRVMNSLP